MRLNTLAIGILMVVATPLAMAEGSGLYVALDVGQSKFEEMCGGNGFPGSCSDTDAALRGALGYQMNQYIGVEGAYVDAGKVTASAPGFSGEAKLTDWQLALVGTLPVGGGGFSLIGKIGADHWSSKFATGTSGSGTSFLWGVGGQFDFNNSVAVRVQYETREAGGIKAPEGLGNVSMLSIGVLYKF